MASFPHTRLRRLRRTERIRKMFEETRISTDDLVCPLFVQEDLSSSTQVGSMPDIQRIPPSAVTKEVDEISKLGIPAVMIFGIPARKDEGGTSAYDQNGVVQNAISSIKNSFGDNMVVMADVCLCQYTSHGHCGIVGQNNNTIDNDSSLETLASIATSQAQAGVDVVSPSAMMDGQVSAIRTSLDQARFKDVAIMSHSAKHKSSMYSPFRDMADCAPQFGDRSTYQLPYTNKREALREVELDISEGVDVVMIKPALAYLDLISEAKNRFNVPVAAYSVSGEYALVKGAANQGWIDEKAVTIEILTGIKRAGADMIVTYLSKIAARAIKNE